MKTELEITAETVEDFELLDDQLAELEKYLYKRDFGAAHNVLQNISNIADNMAAEVEPLARKWAPCV